MTNIAMEDHHSSSFLLNLMGKIIISMVILVIFHSYFDIPRGSPKVSQSLLGKHHRCHPGKAGHVQDTKGPRQRSTADRGHRQQSANPKSPPKRVSDNKIPHLHMIPVVFLCLIWALTCWYHNLNHTSHIKKYMFWLLASMVDTVDTPFMAPISCWRYPGCPSVYPSVLEKRVNILRYHLVYMLVNIPTHPYRFAMLCT